MAYASCSLSPLIFVLFIETLAQVLRKENPLFLFFADNVILSLVDQDNSLESALEAITYNKLNIQFPPGGRGILFERQILT